jgi:hypothetical protein
MALAECDAALQKLYGGVTPVDGSAAEVNGDPTPAAMLVSPRT